MFSEFKKSKDFLKRQMQDTGKFRENTKDQFYTNPLIAGKYVSVLREFVKGKEAIWVEPSAGSGSFIKHLEKEEWIGVDIDPKFEGVIQADFLKWEFPVEKYKDRYNVLFGNPPFGRQSSIAKSFIKKGQTFADTIGFILPLSFTKPSMYGVFNKYFHLVYNEVLPENSFILNDKPYDVKCVFQVWTKKDTERPKVIEEKPSYYSYTKTQEECDFIVRRVGVYAGKTHTNGDDIFKTQSHYFIKLDEDSKHLLPSILEKVNPNLFPTNTTGPRSISKPELNHILNKLRY